MQITSKEYHHLTLRAKDALRDHPLFEPEDIVNDVILHLLESKNENLSIFEIKKLVYQRAKKAIQHNEGQANRDKIPTETSRVCSKCREDIPCGMFYIVTRTHDKSKEDTIENVRREMLWYCKPCHIKAIREYEKKRGRTDKDKDRSKRYYEKQKANPNHKKVIAKFNNTENRKEYMKKYFKSEENRKKQLDRMRDQYKKRKLALINKA